MAENQLPSVCPSCNRILKVTRLKCDGCGTAVDGDYTLPILAKLSQEDHLLILNLLKVNGSLKDLATKYGVSYPTIRNRLDSLISKTEALESELKKRKEKT